MTKSKKAGIATEKTIKQKPEKVTTKQEKKISKEMYRMMG